MSNELKNAELAAHAYDGLGTPMSDQMLAATRECQGQPIDAEPRKVLGPDFNGRSQAIPERFSCEPVPTDTLSEAGLKAATKTWFGAQFDNFSGEHLRKVRNRMRGAIRAYLSASQEAAAPSEEPVAYIARGEDDMPERIWAGDFDAEGFGHCVAGMQGGLYAEYVRADLASPAVAPVAVSVKDAVEALDNVQAWVMQQRIELRPLDPDFHPKYETLKAVGAQIRGEKQALPSIIPATKGGYPDAEAAVSGEVRALRDYAKAATIAITGLTGGGSEYFGKQIGDIYTADLDRCVSRIREIRDAANQRWKDARAALSPTLAVPGDVKTEAVKISVDLLLLAEVIRGKRFDAIFPEVVARQLERADEFLQRLTDAPLPTGNVGEAVDEVTEDEIRGRAKDIIRRNGWLEQKAPPQLHSIIELMVSLGLDVLKNRPASCGYPGCGCDHDAVCNVALAAPPEPVADTGVASMPATGPYVDRIIRIFRDRPDDDTSALVLHDYARAALAAKREPKP